jgi:hypothetical protein
MYKRQKAQETKFLIAEVSKVKEIISKILLPLDTLYGQKKKPLVP